MTALRNVTLTYNLLKPRRIFLFKEPQCFLFNHTQDSLGLLLLQLICQFLGKIDCVDIFYIFYHPSGTHQISLASFQSRGIQEVLLSDRGNHHCR